MHIYMYLMLCFSVDAILRSNYSISKPLCIKCMCVCVCVYIGHYCQHNLSLHF